MKKKKNKESLLISPSILSADFCRLEKDISSVEKAGADMLHVDVMDGNFVPNITIGPVVVKAIRKRTKLPLDVHLMIKDPLFFLDDFIKAGSSIITVHIETCPFTQIKKIKKKLQAAGVKLGVSLNPSTSIGKIKKVLKLADLILIMSVNPGFAGQSFMHEVLPKITQLRAIYDGDIEVDGGITDKTAPLVVERGANILVAGSYVFGAKDRKLAIGKLKNAGN
ncbi:MAG: ribulose-phosphate 3-epimerase [Candidatus Omnitrophota bacterium]